MNLDVDAVTEIVRAAGATIERIRGEGFEVEDKGVDDPVTRADRAADQILKRSLLDLHPCGWLSEESTDDAARLDERFVWVVDPLDGTKEFVMGLPEYSVSVALVENGSVVLGVVHNPVTAETFVAQRGAGAHRIDRAGDRARIRVAEGDLLLASRSELRHGEFDPFEQDWQIEPCGSIAYKLARIAAGEAAATFSRGPKWEWDVCAGALIVAESGGTAHSVLGETLRFNQAFPKVKGILAGASQAAARALATISAMPPSERMEAEFPSTS